jgi:hypothetical protein
MTMGQFIWGMDAMDVELRNIMKTSLFGTAGMMWVIGGFAIVWGMFAEHWALGWGSLFIWVWGCWAGALYFNIKRFLG